MNIDPLSSVLAHIEQLIGSFPIKKGSRSFSVADTFEAVSQIVQFWGRDAEVHLIRCLLTAVDFSLDSRGQPKDTYQAQLLSQVFVANAVVKPKAGFVSSFCTAFDKPLRPFRLLEKVPIVQICRTLRFTPVQEVVLGLCLVHSKHKDTREAATEFLRKTLPELLHSYSNIDTSKATGLQECQVEAVHFLLTSLPEDPDNFGVSAELKEHFVSTLRRDFADVPTILLPWVHQVREDSESFAFDFSGAVEMAGHSSISGSLALQIEEIGYAFTTSVEACSQHMALLSNGTRITASSVASVLSMMVRTHTGLEGGLPFPQLGNQTESKETEWNVVVLARVLNEMAPDLNWSQVVVELDHPGFLVKDRTGLILLTRALLEGLGQNIFPIALLYKDWMNKDGHISWIRQILRHADVFPLSEYPHRSVQSDVLKAAPEDQNKEVANWRSLDLIDTLLRLSDSSGLSHTVYELFDFPVRHCPDVLVLGLLQIQAPMNAMRQELLKIMVPIFLANHPNSSVVLSYMWNPQHLLPQLLRNLVVNAMADWYSKNPDDQTRLTKILDVARDLKDNCGVTALTALFNHHQYTFAVDLACLAARRDFLKLDKWLSDKIQENGESFVAACLNILKRRAPAAVGGGGNIGDRGGQQQLRPDEITAMLTCLHPVANTVSPGLANEIMQCLSNCQQLLQKQTVPVNTPSAHSSLFAQSSSTGLGGGQQTNPAPFGHPPQRSVMEAFPGSAAGSLMVRLDVGGSGLGVGGSGVFGDVLGSGSGLRNPFGTVTPVPAAFGHQQSSLSPARSMFGGSATVSASRFSGVTSGWGPTGTVGFRPPTAGTSAAPQGHPASSLGSGVAGAAGNLGGAIPSSTSEGWGQTANSETLISQNFPEDVQEEANSYFQSIYIQPPQADAIPDFLETLKQFQKSGNKKQQDVFACMLKNLFEEYKFFSEYPDRELYTTAKVYGGIIRDGIISGFPLAIAMRYVIEALKQPNGSKMYNFGICALGEFKNRLKEYPKYSQCIAALTGFSQFPGGLIEFVRAGAKGMEASMKGRSDTPVWSFEGGARDGGVGGSSVQALPGTSVQGPAQIPRGGTKNGPVLSQTNISTLLSASELEDVEQIVDAPEIVQEKVAFMFNNLSQANLNKKVDEMKDILLGSGEEYLPWLSRYLVMKRVSIEPNFHHLYNNFLAVFDSKKLNELVLMETYRNVKVLLRSDKRQAVANFSDRQLLKSLGHWLGMVTLGKNRPILFVDLDLKSLLLEGFFKGQQELLYVVPFITKILESCQKSKVFAPPCSWTMALLNVLAELHQEPDLKLNLKFEIEVLSKALKVDLSSLKPGTLLKDTDKMVSLKQQLDDVTALTKQTTIGGPSPVPAVVAPESVAAPQQAQMSLAEETAADQALGGAASPPPAKFSYHDINVTSFSGLAPHLSINHSLALFQMNPPLKNLVRPAIEHAVRELIQPVAERVIKVAMTTTEHVIKKDFALESDESRMRIAAHHMVRSLTAGMAMITCREPLLLTIQGYLKQAFYSSLRGANNEQQKMIEEAAVALADDNVELSQCFIVKSACEKALPEIDKRLEPEFTLRRSAKMENRRYCDPVSLTYQAQRMPEAIRLKVGMVTQIQQEVYKEFSCNISGFKPTTTDDLIVGFESGRPSVAGPTAAGTGEELDRLYQKMLTEIDGLLLSAPTAATSGAIPALRAMRDSLAIAAQQPRDTVSAQAVIQKLVENLLDAYRSQSPEPDWMAKLRDVFVYSVRLIVYIFTNNWVNKMTTKVLIDCRQDYRYNLDAIDILIRVQLINMVTYDLHLANSMENGLNFQAVNFAQRLVKLYFVEDSSNGVLNQTDLSHTIETLSRLGTHNPPSAEGPMANVLEMLRGEGVAKNIQPPSNQAPSTSSYDVMTSLLAGVTGNAPGAPITATPPRPSFIERAQPAAPSALAGFGGPAAPPASSLMSVAGGDDDPQDLQAKVEHILREWLNIAYQPQTVRDPASAFQKIVSLMQTNGILRTDDMITRFFRLCTEMCSDLSYRLLNDQNQAPQHVIRIKIFYTLDAFVELISLLVKHSGEGQFAIKINLLTKVLGIVASVLLQDHEVRRAEFHALPFHRILILLFWKLTTPDPLLDPINFQILTAFCNCLHVLQPRKAPGFAYAWLDIVGHRAFIGRMLVMTPQQKAWPMYAQLVIDHLKFLVPFLRNIELPKPVALMYKGTLRVLLVLLHDFPELLCDYHYLLCDVIPPNCVQLRNLVLSAYPRNMRLPDPFMPNLKVDQLPEISSSPRITVNMTQLIPADLKADLDSYLQDRSPVGFPADLRSKLQVSEDPGHKYNVSLMNAVVLYVGMQAIQAIQSKEQGPSMSTIAHSSYMDIFQSLAVNLDTEGRYLFFNAIANQLRYPNSHTHYFSCTLLYLFKEANLEVMQEQITRILFERLVALRPHPWGLLITFIELIKNPIYNFWQHQFVRCAPEIERLFESVAASCFAKVQQVPTENRAAP